MVTIADSWEMVYDGIVLMVTRDIWVPPLLVVVGQDHGMDEDTP